MTRFFQSIVLLFAVTLVAGACSRDVEVREGDAAAVAPGGAAAAQAATDPRVTAADTSRIQGNADARVWLVMASDFQCPACKYWHDSFSEEILRDYVATGKVRFAYTNFPLSQHQHARSAAEAAMCAGAQGKFWPVHDRIFAAQDQWTPLPDAVPTFRKIAIEAGVDSATWNQCLVDDVMMPLVDADLDRGMSGGVNQTPTFFIGSQVVSGAIPASRLRPLLDAAIARAGGASQP